MNASQPAPAAPSQVHIDLKAIAHNLRLVKRLAGESVAVMAVVKANAYGHGAVSVSRVALEEGAAWLAVAHLGEALQLRSAGVKAPILVMGYVPDVDLRLAIDYAIHLSLFDLPQIRSFHEAALAAGAPLKAHLKIDSGMGRLGLLPGQTNDLLRLLHRYPAVKISGAYTHFAAAENNPAYSRQQLETFNAVVCQLRRNGHEIKSVHAANSSALLNFPRANFSLVRAGILLYGLMPSDSLPFQKDLRPAMSWTTSIAQVKTLPPDSPVGYGLTYRTSGRETIAILPVGYADGLRRTPHTWREVLVHGRRAPVIGTINMEKTAINISHIPDVTPGDEVVLLGAQGDETISADEIARWLGTVNYEIVTAVLPRSPRH